jgi:hypothetical protein
MAERKRFQAHQPEIVRAAPKRGIHVLWWNWRILGHINSTIQNQIRYGAPGKGGEESGEEEAYSNLTLINTTQTENARSPIAKRL